MKDKNCGLPILCTNILDLSKKLKRWPSSTFLLLWCKAARKPQKLHRIFSHSQCYSNPTSNPLRPNIVWKPFHHISELVGLVLDNNHQLLVGCLKRSKVKTTLQATSQVPCGKQLSAAIRGSFKCLVFPPPNFWQYVSEFFIFIDFKFKIFENFKI